MKTPVFRHGRRQSQAVRTWLAFAVDAVVGVSAIATFVFVDWVGEVIERWRR